MAIRYLSDASEVPGCFHNRPLIELLCLIAKNINRRSMEVNEELREHIFEVIENQIRANNPPETKATYDRLHKQGFDDF